MIQASKLTRRFGARTVVSDVSFEVGRSEIVALLGPNGAGKTTTLRMLAGLIAPTSGGITIDGIRLTRRSGTAVRRRIGFLTETPGLWDRLTVRENLLVYAGLYGLRQPDAAVARLLDTFDLTAHARIRAAELSKGMRQKVALARALLHDPEVLLLDEPTSGLDPEIARATRRLLEERRTLGCAILVSTHNLYEAEQLADRVAVLQGQLVAIDTPATLRRRLTRGRVVVRVAGAAQRYLDVIRHLDADCAAENDILTVTLVATDRDVPLLVRTLVDAGADLLEVRPELPPLEEVYLHLVNHGSAPADAPG